MRKSANCLATGVFATSVIYTRNLWLWHWRSAMPEMAAIRRIPRKLFGDGFCGGIGCWGRGLFRLCFLLPNSTNPPFTETRKICNLFIQHECTYLLSRSSDGVDHSRLLANKRRALSLRPNGLRVAKSSENQMDECCVDDDDDSGGISSVCTERASKLGVRRWPNELARMATVFGMLAVPLPLPPPRLARKTFGVNSMDDGWLRKGRELRSWNYGGFWGCQLIYRYNDIKWLFAWTCGITSTLPK